MDTARLARHLFTTRRGVKRAFPATCMDAIRAAIERAEACHRGEIRFVIEAVLEPAQLMRAMTPRARALELFCKLRVWDTPDNSGVLIYVLFADRAIEIIADRGIHARAGQASWDCIAGAMQKAFASGEFEAGALSGIAGVAGELRRHMPIDGPSPDELPNEVTLL
ncbi:MAG TPA: hypothetical protein DCW29_07085 [Janthinobacterium sp.]|nr:hypothetical protein [Janthinobacterium sp.]